MFAAMVLTNEFKDLNLCHKHEALLIVLKVSTSDFYFKSHLSQDIDELTASVISKVQAPSRHPCHSLQELGYRV